MKRKVANYPEFLEAVHSLFTETSIYDIKTYETEMAASKARRKQKIARISAEINRLKEEIAKYKEKIRKAIAEDNKKETGIRLNRLITAKTALLRSYKEEKNLTPFTELSHEAKVYTCTESLLKKYLFAAFVQTVPNAYHINEDQSVTVNVEQFRNSALYQQAQHLKDYVSSYIEHYPARVRGSRYFVGLHKDAADMEDLIVIADDYFDMINKKNTQDAENLIKSRQGIEVVEIYPEHNVQAVRLLTKEALEYEGKKMNHCVSTYAGRVEKGETEIYSIRDYGDENTEYEPHATIEMKNGKIKQIKGYKDSLVDIDYIEETRLLLMRLMHTNDFADIINSKDIMVSEKYNIGLMANTNGSFLDMLHILPTLEDMKINKIIVKSIRLKNLPLSRMSLQTMEVHGPLSAKILKQLATTQYIKKLVLNAVYEARVLDLSNIQCEKIILSFKNETDIQKIILPANIKNFTFTGNFVALTEITGGENLEQLEGYGLYEKLQSIPQNVKELKLKGDGGKAKRGYQIQFEDYCQLKKISISGDFPQLRSIPNAPQLEKFELTDGTFENLERLNFSAYPNIKDIGLARSIFPNLREIIVSSAARDFGGAHCVYPALERIDISNITFESFGVLESKEDHNITLTEDNGTTHSFTFPQLYGCLMGFSTMPQIKEIKLNEHINRINLNGIHFGAVNPFDFSRYKDLESIDISYSHFSEGAEIDLSPCQKLKKISLDVKHLQQVILPPSVEQMSIRKDKKDRIVDADLSGIKNVKTLFADFCIAREQMPPSLENLSLNLFDEGQSNIEKLDFSTLKSLDIKTSAHHLDLPNLKYVALPEKFNDIILFKVCPNLQELDFTGTKQSVALKEIDFADEIMSTEGTIHLKPEQFRLLKKIKLGKDAYIEFPLNMTQFSFTLELAYDMPKEKEQMLRKEYPNLPITRQPVPMHCNKTIILPKKIITRG